MATYAISLVATTRVQKLLLQLYEERHPLLLIGGYKMTNLFANRATEDEATLADLWRIFAESRKTLNELINAEVDEPAL
jgi:hypothetical protein